MTLSQILWHFVTCHKLCSSIKSLWSDQWAILIVFEEHLFSRLTSWHYYCNITIIRIYILNWCLVIPPSEISERRRNCLYWLLFSLILSWKLETGSYWFWAYCRSLLIINCVTVTKLAITISSSAPKRCLTSTSYWYQIFTNRPKTSNITLMKLSLQYSCS